MNIKKFSKVIILLAIVTYGVCLAAEWIISTKTSEDGLLRKKRFITLREFNRFMLLQATKNSPEVKIDGEGFIEPSKVHQNAAVEIVFLGGSTTACVVVQDSLRFPYLAGRLLEKETALTINSYNAGRSGNDAIDSYIRLLNIIVKKQPDYVVLMHNVNDIINIIYTGSYWSMLNNNRLKVSSFERFENNRMANFSFGKKEGIFPNTRLAIQKLSTKLFPDSAAFDEWKSIREIPLEIDTVRLYLDFESALQSFVHTCKAWNIEPVLMTQQNRISMEDSSFVYNQVSLQKKLENRTTIGDFQIIYSHANSIIRKVAEENQLLLIDLDRSIPKEKEYMYDAIHLTDEGSQQAAKNICESFLSKISMAQQKQEKEDE